MKHIGEKIKTRRNELGITQQELADLTGVSINTIVAVERGIGNPSLSTLMALLDALGLELHCELKVMD